MTNLNDLERAVLEKSLSYDSADAVLLRQIPHLMVERRSFSGVGFVTRFARASTPTIGSGGDVTKKLVNVLADINGISHGAGFVVNIKDGEIDWLEGYSYDEPWPSSIEQFQLKYRQGSGQSGAQA